MTIVVVEIDGRRFGIVVDAVGDTIEAVVKPLTRAHALVPMFAGVTILCDGRPALILDLAGLAAAVGLAPAPRIALPVEAPETCTGDAACCSRPCGGDGWPSPLDAVRRLEHSPAAGAADRGSEVVEYGDAILPLLQLAELVPVSGGDERPPVETAEYVPTIVCDPRSARWASSWSASTTSSRCPLEPRDRPADRWWSTIGDELIDIEALVARAEASRPRDAGRLLHLPGQRAPRRRRRRARQEVLHDPELTPVPLAHESVARPAQSAGPDRHRDRRSTAPRPDGARPRRGSAHVIVLVSQRR